MCTHTHLHTRHCACVCLISDWLIYATEKRKLEHWKTWERRKDFKKGRGGERVEAKMRWMNREEQAKQKNKNRGKSQREFSGETPRWDSCATGGSKLKFHRTLSKAYLWEQFSYSCNISHHTQRDMAPRFYKHKCIHWYEALHSPQKRKENAFSVRTIQPAYWRNNQDRKIWTEAN